MIDPVQHNPIGALKGWQTFMTVIGRIIQIPQSITSYPERG